MSKKNCELCNKPARMFCESDQASLCFPCDEKVHAANFLVAKHSRTLLCHVCSSPTPWSAQGTRLGPTVSVCHVCSSGRRGGVGDNASVTGDNVTACTMDATSTSNSTLEGGDSYSDEESGDFDDYDDSDGCSEEEGENQVVPGSEEDATWQSGGDPEMMKEKDESSLGVKRFHDDDCNKDGCCSSQQRETRSGSSHEINSLIQESDECSDDSFALRPSKIRRRDEEATIVSSSNHRVQSSYGTGTEAIIEKLQSFQQQYDQ